jgi:putative colanic acid biosynthesis acetyltransferase WcaF
MSQPRRYTTYSQSSAYVSPWSLGRRLRLQAWEWCWACFCAWTPKPLNSWRLFWLKAFGARVEGRPFVHSRARVSHPWNLTLLDRACLGDGAHAYALGPIELQAGCTVAQEAYLCSATHDWQAPERPLQTAPIVIGENAFVGLRAIVLPGITIGARSIVGAASVVTRDIAPGQVVAGNPAKPIAPAPAQS